MADRITSEPAGIPRVRTIAEKRWRERTEAADRRQDSRKRKPRPKPRQQSDKGGPQEGPEIGGGIDEFA